MYGLNTFEDKFQDFEIYINELSEDNYNRLKAINNTRIESGANYQFSEYQSLFRGYGRIVFYTASGLRDTSEDDQT